MATLEKLGTKGWAAVQQELGRRRGRRTGRLSGRTNVLCKVVGAKGQTGDMGSPAVSSNIASLLVVDDNIVQRIQVVACAANSASTCSTRPAAASRRWSCWTRWCCRPTCDRRPRDALDGRHRADRADARAQAGDPADRGVLPRAGADPHGRDRWRATSASRSSPPSASRCARERWPPRSRLGPPAAAPGAPRPRAAGSPFHAKSSPHAIAPGEIAVHYQPKVDMATGIVLRRRGAGALDAPGARPSAPTASSPSPSARA